MMTSTAQTFPSGVEVTLDPARRFPGSSMDAHSGSALKFQMLTQDRGSDRSRSTEQQRIAAEVAARYGVQCKPDVVQFVPRGATAMEAEYVWNGTQLVPVDKQRAGDAVRRKQDASWRMVKRRQKFERANAMRRREAEGAGAQDRSHVARMQDAAAARAETFRAMAADGATLAQLAAAMGISEKGARSYCARWGITYAARKERRTKVQVEADARRAEVMAFVGDGKTVGEIAAFLGCTWGTAHGYVRRQGIPTKKVGTADAMALRRAGLDARKAARAAEKAAKEAEAKAKREEKARLAALVVDMFKAGNRAEEIAAETGKPLASVKTILHRAGMKRSDYPALRQSAAQFGMRKDRRDALEARRARVLAMAADGCSVDAIADALGCSVQSVIRDRAALGIKTVAQAGGGYVGDPAMVRRVAAMRVAGKSIAQVAAELRLAKSTVVRLTNAGRAA